MAKEKVKNDKDNKENKKKKVADYLKSRKVNHQKIIPTGIIPFDMVMQGGFYTGDIIELFGDTGTGKSTCVIHIAKNLCDQGYKVLFLDFEKGQKLHDQSIIKKVGLGKYVDNDQFCLLNELHTYTHLEEAIEFAIEYEYDFIFIDSLTAVIPTSVLENPIEKATVGVDARLQTNFVRKYKSVMQMHGKCLLFISQLRTKIGMSLYDTTEIVAAGAKAVGFFGDMRLCLEKGPKLTRNEITGTMGKEVTSIGNKARLFAHKNRAGRPDIKVPCPVLFGKGVSNPYFYYDILTNHKYINTSGAWKDCEFSETLKIRENGETAFIAALAKNKNEVHQFLKERGHFILVRSLDEDISEYQDSDSDFESVYESDTIPVNTVEEKTDNDIPV